LKRKKGLDVEWDERGVERSPLTAEGINTELLLPCWGVRHRVQRGRVEKTQEREHPFFSKALVKTEVMTEPDEAVKNSD